MILLLVFLFLPPPKKKKKGGASGCPIFFGYSGTPFLPPGKNNEVCNGSFAPLRGGSTVVGLRAEVDEGLEGAPRERFSAGKSASPMSNENRGPVWVV